ncbi:galectin-4-like isoform X2 [Amia ocellicauda]|uniref:galectin-4-like isoform X2 n=1 Tax=Amia ocellicauda TaxID=2972642 RepID=UPI003463B496
MAYFAPPGYQPQCNPIMPYLGPLSLRPGMSVYIHGVIPHHITRFEVDLQCGEFEGTDIALHFNPRFDGWDKVVFNTFRDGCWEGEERVREMPFRKGESFELIIIASAEGYQINVNGRQFYMFQHRVPLERVSALRIQGDVTLETLNIIGGGGMGYQGGNLPMMGGAPIYNPQIPYCDMIPGGMTAKRTIIIRGMVPYGANRFHLNFMVGGSRDVAFHLNPRIREGMVVRNSYMGGCWGNEESNLDCNPFQEGQYFEISVRCGNWRYKVFVNGQRLCEFAHRLQPFTQVDTLQVEGDVQLSYIHY